MNQARARAAQDPGERIQQLLDDLQASAGPAVWRKVEALVQDLTALYGDGLRTLIDRAEISSERLCAAAEDRALHALLVLHGLHPLPIEERIRRALEQVRPYLGSHAGDVELLSVDEAGRATLRLLGTCRGCPSSRQTVEGMLRRAVEDAAPELTAIDVEGVAGAEQSAPSARATARWTQLPGIPALSSGERCALEVEGVPVLLLGGANNVLAYRNVCPGCGTRLDGATLAAAELVCAGCGRRFDVVHAGRAVDAPGPHLQPFPVLRDPDGVRISLPGAAR
ncbi:MAG: NifU family protein [Myxococcaceae bacterium]|nr:NifU family protein [Myxococcaceae bacterium]